MTQVPDWPMQLAAAADVLARSPGAPTWLAAAVHDALPVAADLAPASSPQMEPPVFFYPH